MDFEEQCNERRAAYRYDFECRLREQFNIPPQFDFEIFPELVKALNNAAQRTFEHGCDGNDWRPCTAYDGLVEKFAGWMALRLFNHYSDDGLRTVRV